MTRPLYVQRPDVETLVVHGSDRIEWLQGILTCDVADLPPGSGRWGLSLTKPGKILTDVYVVPSSDAILLGIAAGTAPGISDWLDEFIVMEDVELDDESEALSWFMLFGGDAPALAERAAAFGAGWLWASIPWSEAGGAALVGPKASIDGVRSILAKGGDELNAAAWLRYRVGALLPLYGVDYDSSKNPHEASLDRRAVSWTKGCYLGQEAVCMQDMRGKVKRRLVTISIDASEPPASGTAVENSAHEPVGTVTSAAPNDGTPRTIAIASLRAQYAEPGAALLVAGAPATVLAVPPA